MNNRIQWTWIAVLLLAAQVASAQGSVKKAVATLMPAESTGTVKGELHFTQSGKTLHIEGKVEGLAPNSEHGFHVHEKGDCSNPAAKSMGAHFNPMGMPHGGPDGKTHHAGDLGNLKADAQGVARVNIRTQAMSLTGENAILDRSVIVHAGTDDMVSQPAGASGTPAACGVIQAQ